MPGDGGRKRGCAVNEPVTLLVPPSPSANARLADWLIRELMPIGLHAAGLESLAQECRGLPRIDAERGSRPGQLRPYARAARRADVAAHDVYEHRLADLIWPPSGLEILKRELGEPVVLAASNARWALASTKAGYWAYRAFSVSAETALACAPRTDVHQLVDAVRRSYDLLLTGLGRTEPGTRLYTVIQRQEAG